jgi:hypothetical protein
METEEYIEQETKFTDRESLAAPGAAARLDETTYPSRVFRAPSACLIDFFEASNRVPAGLQNGSKEFDINQKASRGAAHQLPSGRRTDRLEDSLYWLFSAATLIYLLFALIGF